MPYASPPGPDSMRPFAVLAGDPRAFFVASSWFDADFLVTGILDDARFDVLAAAVAVLCASYAVDESRFR